MSERSEWMEKSDEHLALTVSWIRERLEQLDRLDGPAKRTPRKKSRWFNRSTESPDDDAKKKTRTGKPIAIAPKKMLKLEQGHPLPALNLLARQLGLSEFGRHVLALCAAMELDTRVPSLCARAQGDMSKPYPTFALAFALFDDPDWNALSPHAPLRFWRLVEINQPGAQTLTSASLVIDERIVNYLKGLNYIDDRLTPLLDPIASPDAEHDLPGSQQGNVENIAERIKESKDDSGAPVIQLLGHDSEVKRLIASHVAAQLGLSLYAIDISALPLQTGDLESFTRLWQRESLLMPLALYLSTSGLNETNKIQLNRFLERNGGVVFVDIDDISSGGLRERYSIEIGKPTPQEQNQLWSDALNGQVGDLPSRLAEQFSFSQDVIRKIAKSMMENESPNRTMIDSELWQACRDTARMGMEKLAKRIDAKAVWQQLILPPDQKALLRQITDQVAQRNRVYDAWGFRQRMNRGFGINALFSGNSGTGKTMAAEVIANALELDLYRIDLSAVVSKYIGETEKNLRKLFDVAEDSGAILFFDEADSLFGKRSEVKDSHDRYANIEINYLLQRMESYSGLAILATNMKAALDRAFVRRLRFIVDFPFPGIAEREAIWRSVFPPESPIGENLDYKRLAKLGLTGGNIHNIALNAAFLGAQENGLITMPLILNAARTEFRKLERPTKESDFKWQAKSGVVS